MKLKPRMVNLNKEIVWDILRCCMLSYEGANPLEYGFDPELTRIGSQLGNDLFPRSEKLIQEFIRQGKIINYYDKEKGTFLVFSESYEPRTPQIVFLCNNCKIPIKKDGSTENYSDWYHIKTNTHQSEEES